MAPITGAATPAAVSGASVAPVDPVDVLNRNVAVPPTERYPGAIDPAPYGIPGAGQPPAGAPAGPVAGGYGPVRQFPGGVPRQPPGGGYQDTGWMSGHNAPEADWDSSAGQPFAPSGAVSPDVHAEDPGAVRRTEHVTPAAIGSLTRRTMVGQTYNRVASTQTTIGQTAPNNRQDLDQQQWHNPDGPDGGGGWAPWAIPYSERPIQNNLSYEAVPVDPTGTAYGVSGGLPDRSPWDYPAQAYQAPADPYVAPAPAPQPGGGGWAW